MVLSRFGLLWCFESNAVRLPGNGFESQQAPAVLKTGWHRCWRAASRIALAAKRQPSKHAPVLSPRSQEENTQREPCSPVSPSPPTSADGTGNPAPSRPPAQSQPVSPSSELVKSPLPKALRKPGQLKAFCLLFHHRD